MLSSATASDRSFTVPSPSFRTSPAFAEQRPSLHDSPRSSPHIGLENGTASPGSGKRDRSSVSNFKFPQVPASIDEISGSASASLTDRHRDALGRTLSPRPNESIKGPDQSNLATRILSPASINGTPRSSGEFYSMSNNSTETLASEYIAPENNRLLYRPAHSRQGSSLAPMKIPQAEVLMMGYGQIMGSFTLDGSLVNQNPFDEAKRKGIIGGQGGGGVVRSNSTKRDTGLLGSFGWGNIGESLGGLLGGNELSSIKETKGSTNARSIPILSTPQSILFVDLQLKPGESKSYTYSHPLPKGIPPTHKGRAIKISYNLVVGTQRAAKVTQQHQVHNADIPFRVLPSVNGKSIPLEYMDITLTSLGQGEILGHDLMSPHTILSNIALISSVDNPQKGGSSTAAGPSTNRLTSSSTDFIAYVESLLDKPHQNPNAGLLSPTEVESRSRTPMANEPSTMKESIDLAILRSNTATSSARGVNRFEITRSGERVAVIMLARPAYRLGETIPVAIDFQDSDVACYSLHATLETSEVIDPAIALRSKASIHRAATRIHASQTETTICAKKVLFNPMIPTSSTPEFITSAISLEWRLRFEFVTSRLGDAEEDEDIDDLMEEVARDERGVVKAAVQGLPCETFDVAVPLRVYGNPSAFDESTEAGDFPI